MIKLKLRELTPTKLAQLDANKRQQLKYGNFLTRIFTRNRQPFDYEANYQKCESPIERLFFAAGWGRLSMLGTFTPQVEIGPYRADFTLTGISQAPLLDVVIECDGWENHSTQDQQAHDRRRDRYMSKRGWTMVRFVGKEIFADPAGCVEELEDMIKVWVRIYRGAR